MELALELKIFFPHKRLMYPVSGGPCEESNHRPFRAGLSCLEATSVSVFSHSSNYWCLLVFSLCHHAALL